MYIEFTLPTGAGGQTANYALRIILNKVADWATKYSIPYRTKIFKYTFRVTFDEDESYTLFSMTWVPDSKYPSWTNYRLVTDLNNKI